MKELLDLQEKFARTSRDFNEVNVKLSINARNKRRSELTLAELEPLGTGVKTYRTVGNLFLQSPPWKIISHYEYWFGKRAENVFGGGVS